MAVLEFFYLITSHMNGVLPILREFSFLLCLQSMGVYLYGELLASEDHIQRLLAETCYEAVAMVMDRGCRRTVEEMMGK